MAKMVWQAEDESIWETEAAALEHERLCNERAAKGELAEKIQSLWTLSAHTMTGVFIAWEWEKLKAIMEPPTPAVTGFAAASVTDAEDYDKRDIQYGDAQD